MGGAYQMITAIEPQLDTVLPANRSEVGASGWAGWLIETRVPDFDPAPEDVPGTTISSFYYTAATATVLKLLEQEGKQIVSIGSASLPTIRLGDDSSA